MSNDQTPYTPVFSIDVSPDTSAKPTARSNDVGSLLVALTRQMIDAQQQQNQLLEQLLAVNRESLQLAKQASAQRQNDLTQWRNAHPKLVRSCKNALETLSGVQTDFLQSLADEVDQSKDDLAESDYVFNEFLDRYGPRMAHLNGVLQVLNHLAG